MTNIVINNINIEWVNEMQDGKWSERNGDAPERTVPLWTKLDSKFLLTIGSFQK